MQRLEISGAVRPIYGSLGVKRLMNEILSKSRASYTRETNTNACRSLRKVSAARFEVLTAVLLQITIFGDVTQCRVVKRYPMLQRLPSSSESSKEITIGNEISIQRVLSCDMTWEIAYLQILRSQSTVKEVSNYIYGIYL